MQKSELVVKSNRLIEASYRLGVNEQRIILYAMCRCREDQTGLLPNAPVVITAEAFAKQFPSIDKTNVYHQLREAMDALYDRSVTLYEDQQGQLRRWRWPHQSCVHPRCDRPHNASGW
jgi:plasmid replication initiation protein